MSAICGTHFVYYKNATRQLSLWVLKGSMRKNTVDNLYRAFHATFSQMELRLCISNCYSLFFQYVTSFFTPFLTSNRDEMGGRAGLDAVLQFVLPH